MAILQIRPEHVKSTDGAYAHLADQLRAMSKEFQEGVVPTNGQTIFNLGFEYKVDGKNLQVYVNGMKQEAGKAYTETDTNTVTFVEGLYDTDYVVFRVQGSGGSGTTYVADHGHVYREVPTGVKDGTNKVFRISKLPISGSELVMLNGILQQSPDDYSMTGDGMDITFVTAPVSGDDILVNYDINL